MKKLAIVFLLVAAGCSRQVNVGTATGPNTPGAATPRIALQLFMAAAKAQDLQAMSNIWGSSAGPARSTMAREEMEMREVSLICYLKHDSYRIVSESPATNNERVFAVETKFRDLTRTASFFATPGPAGRWYLRAFEAEKLQDMCSRR